MFDAPHRAPLERVISFRFRAINIWPRCGQHRQLKQHTVTPPLAPNLSCHPDTNGVMLPREKRFFSSRESSKNRKHPISPARIKVGSARLTTSWS
jgi:hypothetical protein